MGICWLHPHRPPYTSTWRPVSSPIYSSIWEEGAPDTLVVPAGEPTGGIGPDTKWTDYRRWWLAVEISGRGSRIYDRDHKTPAYLTIGVEEVWRIDLEERCAYMARQDRPREVRRTEHLTWQPPGLPEPLTISIDSLFEGTHA